MDTRNAAARFNILASERGGGIAGALLVEGFKGCFFFGGGEGGG